ncbi:MAG: hypothetical protein IJ562_11735 [Prevotella sp.]|nr:hypothetical protein [Prevotella sp.]
MSARLITKYRQFGGLRLVREYWRLGVVPIIVKQLWRVIRTGESSKTIYPAVCERVDPFLLEKYGPLMQQLIDEHRGQEREHLHSNKVWFCWLQGMEQAPDLVKACHRSIVSNLPDRDVTVITSQNYSDYVTLPHFVEEKYRRDIIPPAMFADLIRLELLTRYGGTWMDATVLCTGRRYPKKVMDGNLFMMQYRDSRGQLVGYSNWFITSVTNHPILSVLRELLYQYWNDYDCVLEYYIFHLFFGEISRSFPEEIAAMPRNNNYLTLQLGHRISDLYDDKWMEQLLVSCCFHKLNYRLTKKVTCDTHNFYSEILKRYLTD